jgi:DNA-binding HxlR family transcriptional regulator
MPGKSDLAKLNCSLARAMNLVGDWWTLLILRDAFFGAQRFGEFQASLGVARNILSKRLDGLVRASILLREGPPRRPRYTLTDKGRALLPALVALQQWGDDWASEGGAPVIVTDEQGGPLEPVELRSSRGRVDAANVRFVPGPGATARTRAFMAALAGAQS